MNNIKWRRGFTAAVSALAAAAAPLALPAQEPLSKEITIERDIVPEVRAARRLNVYPKALAQTPRTVTLQAHDLTETSEIPAMIATLDAATTSAAAPLTPFRGYLDAGIFIPFPTAGISAGYGIVSTPDTRLDVWGQFNCESYKRATRTFAYPEFPGDPEFSIDNSRKHRSAITSGRIGLDFSHSFTSKGTLTASTSAGLSSFSETDYYSGDDFENQQKTKQGTFGWNLDALWKGDAADGLRYFIGAGADLFNFTRNLEPEFIVGDGPNNMSPRKAVHETAWNISAGISQAINENSRAGVSIAAGFNRFNHWRDGNALLASKMSDDNSFYWDNLRNGADAKGKSVGVITLSPYYRLDSGILSMKLGVNLQGSVNSGRFLHLSPDVNIALNPAAGFGIWLRADGGEHINSMRSLWDYSRFVSPLLTYHTSSVPVKGELGMRFGPFKGFWIALDLGYAVADNWLMPVWGSLERDALSFQAADLRAWRFGGTLHYDYGTLVSAQIAFHTTAGGDGMKSAWLEWRDRERSRLEASVSVRPTEKLTFDLGYQLAMKRKMAIVNRIESIDAPLGDKSNLSFGAAYRFTNAFSVFVRGENLLNADNWLTPEFAGIGVTGLAGVTFKF